jgi:hypothetical protein
VNALVRCNDERHDEKEARMKMLTRGAAAIAVVGLIAAGTAVPAQAKNGRNTAAAIGFGAGVLAGAALVNANNGYYYAPSYQRGYAYHPGYAYEPGYVYVEPGYGAYAYSPRPYTSCATTPNQYNTDADYAPCY